MSLISKILKAPVKASLGVADWFGDVTGLDSLFDTPKLKMPEVPRAPAPQMPQIPMMPPLVIPAPPMPQTPPAINADDTAERAKAALLAQKLSGRGGRRSTNVAGRKIAAQEQEEEGFFRKQRKASKEKLG